MGGQKPQKRSNRCLLRLLRFAGFGKLKFIYYYALCVKNALSSTGTSYTWSGNCPSTFATSTYRTPLSRSDDSKGIKGSY